MPLTDKINRTLKFAAGRAVGMCPALGVVLAFMWFLRTMYGQGSLGAGFVWTYPVAILLVCELTYMVLVTIYWQRYRPFDFLTDEKLPRLSVIIPAFNEGPMVERSILSVANADYPADRLEILVVDDGSRDDTFFHMEKLRRQHPQLVRLLRFAGNQGKRAALRAGFRAASGEIVLTLDSDSEIDRSTLRAMVAPFDDARIGAVAGRVTVLNRDHWMGRMLDVQFTFSFDFTRAAQSAYRTVHVCPGALSAFRRQIILPHLDRWMDQRFLGRPVGHGEDQALTNVVLRAGYDTVYQRTAIVRTLMPQRYHQLCRVLVRWDRSLIVEGFSFARFMFNKRAGRRRVVPAVAFALSNLRLLLFVSSMTVLPALLLQSPGTLVRSLAVGALLAIFAPLYYLRTERSPRFLYGVVYTFYSFFLLQWILPWALFTVRDERWGTR